MSTVPSSLAAKADYAWEIATLFPEQGSWSEEAYLQLTDGTNRQIEFVDGRLEFLPMPTELHQALVEYLYSNLRAFVEKSNLGVVRFCGLRLRVRPGKIREPDVLFLGTKHYHVRHNRAWDGADLVMEVVSGDPKDRERDYQEKLADYATAKVAEYWIVDFERKVVVINRLDGDAVHVEFTRGQQAISNFLPGFAVDVAALFAVADEIPE
jgi:Uma2 family endonuclease